MTNDQQMEHHDKIEQYVQGQLSPTERLAFERELASNRQLSEALAAYRKSELVIKAAARQQLRSKAAEAFANQARPAGRTVLLQRLAVAASVALLLAAGLWWMKADGGQPSSEQLFAQYYELPPPPTVRSGLLLSGSPWEDAIEAYSKQDYQTAIPRFRELISDPDFQLKETARLLLGLSLLSSGAAEESVAVFGEISTSSSLRQDAEWYGALALLKIGKAAQAKVAFEQIATKERHFKKKEAAAILEQL
jgi:hypothetical protein